MGTPLFEWAAIRLNWIWPKNAEELWAAVAAVATIYLAWVANRISKRQLQLESTPVLMASRTEGHTVVSNVGRGTAFMLFACASDGEILEQSPSLQAGASVSLDRVVPTVTQSHFIYYSELRGQWFRSKITGKSLMGGRNYPIDTDFRPVPRRKLPRSVRLSLRKHARSAVEHLEQVSSLFTAEGWSNRLGHRFKRIRRAGERWYFGLGETSRLRAFESWSDQGPETVPNEADRAKWEMDLNGVTRCWHSSGIQIRHLGCFDGPEGSLVCELRLEDAFQAPPVRGLAVVSAETRSEYAAVTRSARLDAAWEIVARYVCARRPRERFVIRL